MRVRITAGAVAALLAAAGLFITTSPVDAGGPQHCVPGDACVYYRSPQGWMVLYGGYSGNARNINLSWENGGEVVNHGTLDPGADHLEVTIRTGGGVDMAICLHRGETDYTSPDQTAVRVGKSSAGTMLGSVIWRGECASWENNWHRAGWRP